MNTVSNTYIVWFAQEFEAAESAATALNGQVLPVPDKNCYEPADLAAKRLQQLGYSSNMIDAVVPAAEYIRRENQCEMSPSRCYNCYSAAVVVPSPVSHNDWLSAFRNPGFCRSLPEETAYEVFAGILDGRRADYGLLMEAVSHCDNGEPADFLLVPVAAELGGYDDIAYLLKDVEYGRLNLETVLADMLDETGAEWLYRRNRETVCNWMREKGLSLEDFGHSFDQILQVPQKVRWEVVYRWACDTVVRYLDSLIPEA